MSNQRKIQQGEEPRTSETEPNRAVEGSVPDTAGTPPIDWQGLTEETDPDNPVVETEKTGESKHDPKPDARDEEKVERLVAPDWRAEQPLPSARNAVDPRGENTPPELFEPPEKRQTKE